MEERKSADNLQKNAAGEILGKRYERYRQEEIRMTEDGKITEDRNAEEATYGTPDAEDMAAQEGTGKGVCACDHYKSVPRDDAAQKKLQNRINRIIGQLNGIKNMIGENRYCGDILIQIGAVENALQSLGYIVLQEHMQTCVVEEVKKGNEAIMVEAIDLIRKLK